MGHLLTRRVALLALFLLGGQLAAAQSGCSVSVSGERTAAGAAVAVGAPAVPAAGAGPPCAQPADPVCVLRAQPYPSCCPCRP